MAKMPKKGRFSIDESKEVSKDIEPLTKTTKQADKKNLPNSKDRVKLTTMINPVLRDKLKMLAIKRNCNFSDVLEEAINEYLKA